MTTPAPSNITLIRGLGLIAAVSIVIGNVIGTGVFLKTRTMTCNVGSPGKVIAVWIVAGVLSVAGALTYAELAAMMPRAGGEYVFLREAYGPRWGFLYGWMQFFVARAGGLAAMSAAFAIFANDLTGGSLSKVFYSTQIFGKPFSFGSQQIVALGVIATVTLINCAAVFVSGNIAAILTAVKVSLVLAVGVGAFFLADGNWANFALINSGGACAEVEASARGGMAGFGAAMIGALWAYNGWNDLTLVAEEVKKPQRNIPLALIGGMAVVVLLYVFVNLAYFYVLTPTEIASISPTSSVATEVARRFMGPLAASLIAAALLASTFGTIHVGVLTGARVPYAMAKDRLFFQNMARLSKRTHVPVGALFLQAGWAGALALSGSFDALSNYSIFALWIFYALTTATVFVFRRRAPQLERPYRTWGYPIVPIAFLIVAGWLLVMTIVAIPRASLTGLGLIALGLPVYYYWHKKNEKHK
jgi:APA family basic amino acid/polyamine antiporter